MSGSRLARSAFQYQEIAFSVCMGAVAFLGPRDPDFSAHALCSFAALLAFNLLYQIALRKQGEYWQVPLVSMAANSALITWVLAATGGSESDYWPLYLLPIFTACLYLESRHVLMAAGFSVAFLGAHHLDPNDGDPLPVEAAEFLLKAIVLGLSALITAQHAGRERSAREALQAARGELDRLSADVERVEEERLERAGGLSRFMEGIIYDVQGRLSVILGSAELLRRELGAGTALARDAERIQSAAAALGQLTADVLRLSRTRAELVGECRLDKILEQALRLVAHDLRAKGVSVELRAPKRLPACRASVPHVQQAMLDLVRLVCERAAPGSKLAVSAKTDDGRVRARLKYRPLEDAAAPALAPQRKALAAYDGDAVAAGSSRSMELVVTLPVHAARPGDRA